MNQDMCSFSVVSEMIAKGKKLLIAGDQDLLSMLPEGQWIGGSTQYFMTQEGALTSTDKIMVTELPEFIGSIKLCSYDADTIKNVYADSFDSGISFIIIPAYSQVHFSFALNAPLFDSFAVTPLIGWLSAIPIGDTSNKNAKSFIGSGLNVSTENAVVMHAELPKGKYANLEMINNFEQGPGDTIEFVEDGFSAKEALINGTKQDFAKYLTELDLIVQLPLVANYCGTMVNVSIQHIDRDNGVVNFYAPVFKNIEYKLAKRGDDMINGFSDRLTTEKAEAIVFSCNCILNYLALGNHEKENSKIVGPVSFGEIVYQLLNQTYVYAEIKSLN